MYTDTPSKSLRQGDVIKGLLICRAKLESYQKVDAPMVAFKPDIEFADVVLISQCCDIGKRPYFFVAPLEKINPHIRTQSYYGDLVAHVSGKAFNLFYYSQTKFVEEESYIDFSKAIPVEKNRVAECLSRKAHELTIPVRDVFRKNLALNFGRAPEEDTQ